MARGVLGVLAMLAAAASLVTGVFLSFNYAPTWEAAHAAVQHTQTEVGLGWLLRGIHHWGGVAAVGFALLEGARRADRVPDPRRSARHNTGPNSSRRDERRSPLAFETSRSNDCL